MFRNIVKKVFGDPMEKALSGYQESVDQINALEPAMQKLSDAEMRAKTAEFKAQLANGARIEDIMIEAFALVREASVRTIGLRHYDVQLIGGIVLHEGRIAEMKTGEGKTLVATLPLYLNALGRAGRPSGHAQRLPEQTRPAIHGTDLSPARSLRRRHPKHRRHAR